MTLAVPAAAARRPRTTRWAGLVLAALALWAVASVDWNLEFLTDAGERARAWRELQAFLTAFGAPDLSAGALLHAGHLALQTLAIALLGTALAAVAGWLLAVGASRAVVCGHTVTPTAGQRAVVEGCRLLLDALRGVPDFAWAVILLAFTGPGPLTGILAIGVSVSGILGKVYSEQWDALDPARTAAQRSTGAGRLQVLLYGLQPLAGRSMLSFTLMRAECAVRNASVIGVICGGGLGAAMKDQLLYDDYPMVLTLLGTMLLLTAGTDLLANLLRAKLRVDPNHPRTPPDHSLRATNRRRWAAWGTVAVLLAGAVVYLAEPLQRGFGELARLELGFVGGMVGGLLTPDLSAATLARAWEAAGIPLALGSLATLLSTALAAGLAYPASVAFQWEPHRFTGEATTRVRRTVRRTVLVAARVLALVSRSIPEVAWLIVLGILLGTNATSGLLAMTVHSTGVLARVFTEALDNVPYRRLEHSGVVTRSQAFLYAGLPHVRADWTTYAMFQLEINVRATIVLGMIGVGGLGFSFYAAMSPPFAFHAAGTYVLAMVLITVGLDRLSRRLKAHRVGC